MELDVLCYGFVNPWGHHFDAWGQSFATDGAYHEGINYVFPGAVFVTAPGANRFVAGLNPGSPKHCGLEIVSGAHFPPDWTGNMITSDFRAHRVCRFVVSEDGAGYASRQEVEVIKSNHVAFRPIDAKMGPRGELFVADWYNPIIQHGEVDFRDPRRDHVHGRIWRVSARGRTLASIPDYQRATDAQLLDWLKAPEEWVRLNAKLTLKQRALSSTDRAAGIAAATREWLSKLDAQSPSFEHDRLEGLWVYQNLGHLEPALLRQLLTSQDHRVRAAALRVASEWATQLPDGWNLIRGAVADAHPRVRLEAVRALALWKSSEAAEAAIQALDQPLDRFLDFALWQTMRDLEPAWLPAVSEERLRFGDNGNKLFYALKAVDSRAVVPPLLDLMRSNRFPLERSGEALALITSRGGSRELANVLHFILDPPFSMSAEARTALLESMAETARTRKIRPAGDVDQIQSLFSVNHEPLRAAALRTAGLWKLQSARNDISRIAADRSAGESIRMAAVDAIASLGGDASINALEQLAASDDTFAVRAAAVNAMASIAPSQAAPHAIALLQNLRPETPPAAVLGGLLAQRSGPEALRAAIAGKTLPADIAKLAVRAVQASNQPSPELAEAFRKAGNLSATGWTWTPQLSAHLVAAVGTEGNAARGEQIYRRSELQCTKCHAIAGAGGRVGPDMVSLGATAQIDYIVESMLAPSAKIKENFHSKTIATSDGRIIMGIPVRESGTELVLRDAEDREVKIPLDSIAEKKDGRSLMPDGSVELLTRAELLDLLRFLSELGKVGDFAVSNAPLARRWEMLSWTNAAHQRLNRTSHDTVATNDSALTWQPVYSTVAGVLPIDQLPRFQPHRETDPTSFVRCQVEVTTPGEVRLRLNSTAGLALWLDGKPAPVTEELKVEWARGTHTLTFDINHSKRQIPLKLELLASTAQAQLVSGK
jgi:putative heme-binding domain-containing protein